MKFELEHIFIEQEFRESALSGRIRAHAPEIALSYVADGREAALPVAGAADPFAAGKRRLVVLRRRSPFVMACPAGGAEFACCGYLIMALASNCPMDCSYCFLQEYVANNPGFQVFGNYAEAFDELEVLTRRAPSRHFRIGTGELADSLAFDHLTGLSLDLVAFFARQPNLLLELKTKTDEIGNLLRVDPQGRVLVSWTLSPHAVFASSEHRTAPPTLRIAAARKLSEAGYKVAFHLDPIFAYPDAARDYVAVLDELFDTVAPARIAFISLGGLRMTPGLRQAARRRFPADPMLVGEEVLAPDGRYRTFLPLRTSLMRAIASHIGRRAPGVANYLCMESATMSERVFGRPAPRSAHLGERLAQS